MPPRIWSCTHTEHVVSLRAIVFMYGMWHFDSRMTDQAGAKLLSGCNLPHCKPCLCPCDITANDLTCGLAPSDRSKQPGSYMLNQNNSQHIVNPICHVVTCVQTRVTHFPTLLACLRAGDAALDATQRFQGQLAMAGRNADSGLDLSHCACSMALLFVLCMDFRSHK